ncbi:Bcr/CflA family efflux MFS transporter [Demequina sp. NBRC 110056]|uniref:Bcr/CflA family efflux MFS transporter n=1 Tax=Demequina sp. NBRC 110056 TaxID=1570345 RepID=UPI0013565C20|nr:Bcr/CflA family efflux MFS transporter [Demequina sp. NBRC 110056]
MSGHRPVRTAPLQLTVGVFLTLGLIQAIWPLTMDLYLPAFPAIVAQLDTSAAAVQATLTAAFAGMAVGQLIAGPWSDRIGRLRPLLVALALYTIASVVCALAPSAAVLVGARAVQGLGAASAAVITVAVVRDASEGSQMVRALARLQLVNGSFVVLAPSMGAYLLHVMPWRGLFWLLGGVGVLLTVLTVTVLGRAGAASAQEGAAEAPRARLYGPLLRDRRYVLLTIGGGLMFAAMMSYMASSAFLFLDHYGLTESTYALIFGGHGLLMIAGAQVSARLATRARPMAVIVSGASVLLAAAVSAAVLELVLPDSLIAFVAPLYVFTAAFGAIGPALQAVALQPHGERAGSAASLQGASKMLSGAAAAPVVGALGVATPGLVGGAMAIAATLALALYIAGARVRVHADPRDDERVPVHTEGRQR